MTRRSKIVTAIVVGAPVVLWVIHLALIVPWLGPLTGEAKFHAAMYFFAASSVVMIGCGVVAAICWLPTRDHAFLLAIVLNMTWLYYVKVLFYGPTYGDF